MAHIELAAPVAHIWYLKSVPSRVGLMLDIPIKKLDQVVYFAAFVITDVYADYLRDSLSSLEDRYKQTRTEMQKEFNGMLNEAKIAHEAGEMENDCTKRLDELDEEYAGLRDKLKSLEVGMVISELDYRSLHEKFPQVFQGGTGAESIRKLLDRINLADMIQSLQKDIKTAPKSKEKKLLQKLRLAIDLFSSDQHPRDFIMEALQILPPDLRPMIQLDGGRMASSDLNDLYRRVINRNNRLKKLIQLGAPDVILKNEKRMLQESADALISGSVRSSRSGYAMANKRKLKSLTDVLKGKQGRFRQNLLGKRVDYSARSVIVVGPKLQMDQCGLPKTIALTLFRPFVIGKLIEREYAFNVKHAEKIIEDNEKEVWDALEEVIEGKYVLLNRAPTLHRLGIQAFQPVLIEGKAIQLHPLTCVAFNADFDGDQMAIHLPLTPEAQKEARELMATSANMLNPSNGEPIVSPTQDMILGCYYLTKDDTVPFSGKVFGSYDEANIAYQQGDITLHTPIRVRGWGELTEGAPTTTYGRIVFHHALPVGYPFQNVTMNKKQLSRLLGNIFENYGTAETAKVANEIKNVGFKYATVSGLSISESDMMTPDSKTEIIASASVKVREIQKMAYEGFLTDDERYGQSIRIWSQAKNDIETAMKKVFPKENHIYHFIDSGAR
jgi:DNA-directed RNA polymerase subunit beta'